MTKIASGEAGASGRGGRRPSAPTEKRCRWCAHRFEVVPGPGRPKEYCRRSCRQRDYEARRRSVEAGLGEGQLVVARSALDALHDRLYELEAAIEDVDRDLAGSARPTAAEYREALSWVLAVARPLAAVRLGE